MNDVWVAPSSDSARGRRARWRLRLAIVVVLVVVAGGLYALASSPSAHDDGFGQVPVPPPAPAPEQLFGPPITPMFHRTSASGAVIRVNRQPVRPFEPPVPPPGVNPGFFPPASCLSAAGVQAHVSTENFVGTVFSSQQPNLVRPIAQNWTPIGHPSLELALAVLVQVPSGVTSVRLLHNGAVVDEMAPEQGWAALAGTVPAEFFVSGRRPRSTTSRTASLGGC